MSAASTARPGDALPTTELFLLSAKTEAALQAAAARLLSHVEAQPTLSLHDLAFSLATRRSPMERRLAIVAGSREELLTALRAPVTGDRPGAPGRIAFLFTGQGAQRPGMAKGLHAAWPAYREAFDRCVGLFQPLLDLPLQDCIWAEEGSELALALDQTGITQPALFTVEYALAALLASFGLRPQLLLGHSVGELVAACVAGVFTLEEAVRLVAARGRLMQALPAGGAMVSIPASEARVAARLVGVEGQVSIAAINGPDQVVVSGEAGAVLSVAARFEAEGARCRRLRVSHAFHSPLMEPMLEAFERVAGTISFQRPQIPLVSNVSGQLADDRILTPRYWVDQLRGAVRFADGLRALAAAGATRLVELGPQPTLLSFAAATLSEATRPEATLPAAGLRWIPTLRAGRDDTASLLGALGALWTAGARLDPAALFPSGGRPVPLPTYPWQRQRCWPAVAPPTKPIGDSTGDLLYEAVWTRQDRPLPGPAPTGRWLIYADDTGVALSLLAALTRARVPAVAVWAGRAWRALEDDRFVIRPGVPEDAARMLKEADAVTQPFTRVVQLWGLDGAEATGVPRVRAFQARALTGTLHLVQALAALQEGARSAPAPRLSIVTRQVHLTRPVDGLPAFAGASLWGLGRTIAAEHPDLWGGLFDIPESSGGPDLAARLVAEVMDPRGEEEVALRSHGRYALRLRPAPADSAQSVQICGEAAYLITGGLGALGLLIADRLVIEGARHIVLVGRSPLPPRERWEALREEPGVGPRIAAVRALEAKGARVYTGALDITDEPGLRALLDALRGQGCPPIRGVVHAAAEFRAGPLRGLSAAELDRSLEAKGIGALVLERCLGGEGLEFFLLLSSVAGSLPDFAEGLGGYAAGNALLDGLAHHLRARGHPATSFDAGPWADGASADAALMDKVLRFFRRVGVRPFTAGEGTKLFMRVLRGGAAQRWGIALDRSVAAQALAHRPLLRELWSAPTERTGPTAVAPSLPERLAALPFLERQTEVTALLRRFVADSMGQSESNVPLDLHLNTLGLDSLMAVELRRRVQAELGVNLPAAMLIEGAAVRDLADRALRLLSEGGAQRVAPVAAPVPVPVPVGDRWIVLPAPRRAARLRLFCFPYAGGGPALFHKWAARLPEHVELCAVQLAGRGARLSEPPLRHMDAVADALAQAIRPWLDRPFAFFGHCIGALQMFELAHRLRASGGPLPSRLFVSGARAPSTYTPEQLHHDVLQFSPNPEVPGHRLPEAQLLELMRSLNFGTSTALYEDAELRRLLAPMVQADLEVNNTYHYAPRPLLDCPITAVGGRTDPFVTASHLMGWKGHTRGAYALHMRPGDHYFIEAERPFWLDLLARELGAEAM